MKSRIFDELTLDTHDVAGRNPQIALTDEGKNLASAWNCRQLRGRDTQGIECDEPGVASTEHVAAEDLREPFLVAGALTVVGRVAARGTTAA
jgi:hypothetical protein